MSKKKQPGKFWGDTQFIDPFWDFWKRHQKHLQALASRGTISAIISRRKGNQLITLLMSARNSRWIPTDMWVEFKSLFLTYELTKLGKFAAFSRFKRILNTAEIESFVIRWPPGTMHYLSPVWIVGCRTSRHSVTAKDRDNTRYIGKMETTFSNGYEGYISSPSANMRIEREYSEVIKFFERKMYVNEVSSSSGVQALEDDLFYYDEPGDEQDEARTVVFTSLSMVELKLRKVGEK